MEFRISENGEPTRENDRSKVKRNVSRFYTCMLLGQSVALKHRRARHDCFAHVSSSLSSLSSSVMELEAIISLSIVGAFTIGFITLCWHRLVTKWNDLGSLFTIGMGRHGRDTQELLIVLKRQVNQQAAEFTAALTPPADAGRGRDREKDNGSATRYGAGTESRLETPPSRSMAAQRGMGKTASPPALRTPPGGKKTPSPLR